MEQERGEVQIAVGELEGALPRRQQRLCTRRTMEAMSLSAAYRMPGVLNSKQLLIAEAIQARAVEQLRAQGLIEGTEADTARAKLGGIVVRLMADSSQSIADLSASAVRIFREDLAR